MFDEVLDYWEVVSYIPYKVFDYVVPCSLQQGSAIVLDNDQNFEIKFHVNCLTDCFASLFTNVVESENEACNLTESFTPIGPLGDQQHQSVLQGTSTVTCFHVPHSLTKLHDALLHKNPHFRADKHFKFVLRLEPKMHPHRFVNCYYFQILRRDGVLMLDICRHKVEIAGDAFFLFDVYGLDSLAATTPLRHDSVEQFCKICMTNVLDMIVLPCRHMCLCNQCAMLYQETDLCGEPSMKRECPVCRSPIQGFIQYLQRTPKPPTLPIGSNA
jgi:hypothetical protein